MEVSVYKSWPARCARFFRTAEAGLAKQELPIERGWKRPKHGGERVAHECAALRRLQQDRIVRNQALLFGLLLQHQKQLEARAASHTSKVFCEDVRLTQRGRSSRKN